MTIFLYGISIAIIYFGGLNISKPDNIELILAGNTEVITVGKVMQSLTYVSMILMSVMQLAMISQHVTRALVSANRISEVLDSILSITNNNEIYLWKQVSRGTIEFKNVFI